MDNPQSRYQRTHYCVIPGHVSRKLSIDTTVKKSLAGAGERNQSKYVSLLLEIHKCYKTYFWGEYAIPESY